MRERDRDRGRLQDILQAADNIASFTEGLSQEELTSDKLRYYAVVKNVEIIVQLRFHSLMKEFDICGLEIFGQEGTLYLLFKLREKIQIFLLYAIEYNLGYAASSERRHKVGILDMLLFPIEV